MSQSMRIVKVLVRNTMKVSTMEVTPSGPLVTLGGKNGAGKSSFLKAIEMLLGGKRVAPERPIRTGAARAQQLMILRDSTVLDGGTDERDGDVVVERVITEGSDRLSVRVVGGAQVPKPQAALERLYTALTFDPMNFVAQAPREQAKTLRRLLGLDFSQLDQRRAVLYADRTEAGRDRDAAAARVRSVSGPFPDAPSEPLSVAVLSRELERRLAQAAEKQRLQQVERQAVRAVEDREPQVQGARERVELLKKQLQDATDHFQQAEAALVKDRSAATAASAAADGAITENVQEARQRLGDVERVNAQVKANADRRSFEAEQRVADAKYDDLTGKIAAIDEKKAEMIRAAKFPIEGLSFGAESVLYQGAGDVAPIPFSQASSGIQIRASVAIGFALNPRLRVLFVRDGARLDPDGLQLIAELAAAAGGQVWVEDNRTTDPEAIIIEDGHIRGVEPEPELPISDPPAETEPDFDPFAPPAVAAQPAPGTAPPQPADGKQGGLFQLPSGAQIERTARPGPAKKGRS